MRRKDDSAPWVFGHGIAAHQLRLWTRLFCGLVLACKLYTGSSICVRRLSQPLPAWRPIAVGLARRRLRSSFAYMLDSCILSPLHSWVIQVDKVGVHRSCRCWSGLALWHWASRSLRTLLMRHMQCIFLRFLNGVRFDFCVHQEKDAMCQQLLGHRLYGTGCLLIPDLFARFEELQPYSDPAAALGVLPVELQVQRLESMRVADSISDATSAKRLPTFGPQHAARGLTPDIDLTGTPCQDWSAIGARLGIFGLNWPIFRAWQLWCQSAQPKILVHENVPEFPILVLFLYFSAMYHIYIVEVDPVHTGCDAGPIASCITRSRPWCCATRLTCSIGWAHMCNPLYVAGRLTIYSGPQTSSCK